MAPPRLLLHVGLHKTGTTWLQKHVFAARHGSEISYCGDIARIYRAFILPSEAEFSPEAARAGFAPLLDEAAAKGRLAVLSAENLAGRPFHARFQREIVAARLARTFPEAHILLTIREQAAVIYSIYGQYLRFGHTSSLEDFLAEPPAEAAFLPILDRSFYDYDRLIATYARIFPEARIITVPFEGMLADPDAMLARLAARTGAALSPVGAALGNRGVNPALSDLAYAALRFLNRFEDQDSRWRHGGRRANSIASRIDRLVPRGLARRMKQRRMALIRTALGDHYAASNRAAAQRTGLDLGGLGYSFDD